MLQLTKKSRDISQHRRAPVIPVHYARCTCTTITSTTYSAFPIFGTTFQVLPSSVPLMEKASPEEDFEMTCNSGNRLLVLWALSYGQFPNGLQVVAHS